MKEFKGLEVPSEGDEGNFQIIYRDWDGSKDGCDILHKQGKGISDCDDCETCILGKKNFNTFKEYMSQKEDNTTFKEGDRVEYKGREAKITLLLEGHCALKYDDGGSAGGVLNEQLKLIKTTEVAQDHTLDALTYGIGITQVNTKDFFKEETMKENNTNQDVLAVFGSKVKGDELVVIDRHFDEAMLSRILMEKFSKEIQDECKDAEEKRLAEAAK